MVIRGATTKRIINVDVKVNKKDMEFIMRLRKIFNEVSAERDDKFGQYMSLGSGACFARMANGRRCRMIWEAIVYIGTSY
jgi:hypothetical protein